MKGINPMESHFFLFSFTPMLPFLIEKTYAAEEKVISDFADEFREMGATEFLNYLEEFKKIPHGKLRTYQKEAYGCVYLERYGKDIMSAIPGYGEP